MTVAGVSGALATDRGAYLDRRDRHALQAPTSPCRHLKGCRGMGTARAKEHRNMKIMCKDRNIMENQNEIDMNYSMNYHELRGAVPKVK